MRRAIFGLLLSLSLSLPCWAGGSRDFDGTTDYIEVASNTAFNTIPGTVCFWLFPDTAPNYVGVFSRSSAISVAGIIFGIDSDPSAQLRFEAKNSAGSRPFGQLIQGLTLGQWTHYCGVFAQNGSTARLYVNGIQTDSASVTLTWSFGDNVIRVGTLTDVFWADLNGQVAHALWYSKELSVAEVNQVMNFPGSVADSLEGYWPLFGNNSPEIDLSGNGRIGTVSGATESNNGPPVYLSSPITRVWNKLMRYLVSDWNPYRRGYTRWDIG